MATQQFDGMAFSPPADFQHVETMLSLRAPKKEELRDPRLLQGILNKEVTVQSNIIVHRRNAKPNTPLQEIVGEACAEFLRSMVKLKKIEKKEFTFSDQNEGILVSFDFPATQNKTLRQYHAFRLDDGKLTTLTLTIDAIHLSPDKENEYLQSLASLSRQT